MSKEDELPISGSKSDAQGQQQEKLSSELDQLFHPPEPSLKPPSPPLHPPGPPLGPPGPVDSSHDKYARDILRYWGFREEQDSSSIL